MRKLRNIRSKQTRLKFRKKVFDDPSVFVLSRNRTWGVNDLSAEEAKNRAVFYGLKLISE